MLALPGPKLVNQSAKIAPKPQLMPKDNVALGKVSVSKKLIKELTVNFYVITSLLCIFVFKRM